MGLNDEKKEMKNVDHALDLPINVIALQGYKQDLKKWQPTPNFIKPNSKIL